MKNCKNCVPYNEFIEMAERVKALEMEVVFYKQNITSQHQIEYDKNRKALEKIGSQYKKISNFLKVIGWIFKSKKRIVAIVILRLVLLVLLIMFVDSFNSTYFQYGKFHDNMTKFLWEIVKIWSSVK